MTAALAREGVVGSVAAYNPQFTCSKIDFPDFYWVEDKVLDCEEISLYWELCSFANFVHVPVEVYTSIEDRQRDKTFLNSGVALFHSLEGNPSRRLVVDNSLNEASAFRRFMNLEE